MAEIKPLVLNSGDYAEMSPTADSIRVSSLGVGVASPGAGSLSMTGTLTVSSMGAGALVTDASGVASSIPGVAGQLLTSNGPGVAPSFQAPPPASVDIGSSIPSGTAGRVLFVGAGPALAEDAAFTWDTTGKELSVENAVVGTLNGVRVRNTSAGLDAYAAALFRPDAGSVFVRYGVVGTGWTLGLNGADAFYGLINATHGITINNDASGGGDVRLAFAGTVGLRVGTSGYVVVPTNLGVGVTPTARLHVEDTQNSTFTLGEFRNLSAGASAFGSVTLRPDAGSVFVRYGVVGSGWVAGTSGADAYYGLIDATHGLTLNVSAGYELRLSLNSIVGLRVAGASGNVEVPTNLGIGVAPTARLHIEDSQNSTYAFSKVINTSAGNAAFGNYLYQPDAGSVYVRFGGVGSGWVAGTNGADAYYGLIDATHGLTLNVATGYQMRLALNGTVRLAIDATGMGFFNTAPVAQQAVTDLTNGITAGGTADTLTNYGDLTVYANDALLIRDNFYQLGQKVVQILAALKNYGILV